MAYGYIEDDKVIMTKTELPASWKNISGFNNLSDEEAKLHGWYSIVQDDIILLDWQKKTETLFNFVNDEIIETWNIGEVSLEDYKLRKLETIKQAMYAEILLGCTVSLGFKIDCKSEDLANWTSNYNHMVLEGATETVIRDFDNNLRTLSLDDYKILCMDVGNGAKLLLGKKWGLQEQINNATSYEIVEGVNW